MKILLRLILIAGLSASFSVSAEENYLGVWVGTLTQMIVAGQKYAQTSVTITVTPKKYHIDYELLGCGGVLRLEKHRGRFYRFRDELKYGLKSCDNGGRTEIHFINGNLAVLQWFDRNGALKVEGYLKRQQQLMI